MLETFDFLKDFHRKAPFFFFNGNTFAAIGRQLTLALFDELSLIRRREISSAVAHYIAGVLDRGDMIAVVDSLCSSASFQPGDRVKTLRGTLRGVVVTVLEDGRISWRPDGSAAVLSALPESLAPET